MILLRSVFIIALVAVAMIGVMVPSVFADEIPLEAKEKILDQKIPTWVKSVGVLLVEDKITNDEFDNVLKFLIKTEIILPEQTSFKNFVTDILFDSNYNTMENSELNTPPNSFTMDISKYETRKECTDDLMKNNQKTILNIKQCAKIIEDHTKIPKMYNRIEVILENRNKPNADWYFSTTDTGYYKESKPESNKPGGDFLDRDNTIRNVLDARDFDTRDECLKVAREDGTLTATEKNVCVKVNRTWAVDTIIYDDYGNKVGTQALNNCNDSNCNSNYQYGNYYYGNYGYDFNMDAEVQYALNRADHYAYQSLDALDTYVDQWMSGQISYGEYERKAMASMEYYGNQYAYEMQDYWDSKYGYYP